MSASMIGAVIGFVVGLLGFVWLRFMAARMENQPGEQSKRVAGLLRIVALFDFIFFIVIGYIVGPMIIENTG